MSSNFTRNSFYITFLTANRSQPTTYNMISSLLKDLKKFKRHCWISFHKLALCIRYTYKATGTDCTRINFLLILHADHACMHACVNILYTRTSTCTMHEKSCHQQWKGLSIRYTLSIYLYLTNKSLNNSSRGIKNYLSPVALFQYWFLVVEAEYDHILHACMHAQYPSFFYIIFRPRNKILRRVCTRQGSTRMNFTSAIFFPSLFLALLVVLSEFPDRGV